MLFEESDVAKYYKDASYAELLDSKFNVISDALIEDTDNDKIEWKKNFVCYKGTMRTGEGVTVYTHDPVGIVIDLVNVNPKISVAVKPNRAELLNLLTASIDDYLKRHDTKNIALKELNRLFEKKAS